MHARAGEQAWTQRIGLPQGQVYGVALNFRGALAAVSGIAQTPPYGAPPRAPVLYIKPRNTWCASGDPVPLPAGAEDLLVGATLGIVIGRTARNVAPERVRDFVAGFMPVNDLTLPHESFYRPPLRYNARDGFCPLGSCLVPWKEIRDPNALAIHAYVNGERRMTNTTANLVRDVGRLIAEVTEFMTLRRGDVLTVGVPENAPRARAGDMMAVEIEGVGRLENPLVPEVGVLVEGSLDGAAT